MTPETEMLIVKYLSKSATAEELEVLSEWIKDKENLQAFKAYVQLDFAAIAGAGNPDKEKMMAPLLQQIRREKTLFYRLKTPAFARYAAAAVFIGVVATTYFLWNNKADTGSVASSVPVVVNNHIEPGKEYAVLTLEDGTEKILGEGAVAYQSAHAQAAADGIVYKDNAVASGEVGYNSLTVPRGGQYKVTLADGTQVWLNADSRLRYPVEFKKGESRTVELVYGEAYFDVSPSTQHQGADFKVMHDALQVKVLGTEFNVRAYKTHPEVYTTLVEGKVAISVPGKAEQLLPDQQAIFTPAQQTLVVKAADALNEVAWKDGAFNFERASMKDIMEVLERWYDMEVVFDNSALQQKRFNGSILRKSSIEDVLLVLRSNKCINTYEINNKTITLR